MFPPKSPQAHPLETPLELDDPNCPAQRGTSWATIPKTLNRARTVHAPCDNAPLQQFLIRRQVRYPPYGPWEHVPAHVWTAPTQEDNDDEDVVGDDGDVCALCCTKSDPEKMSMCDKCELQYCTDCIDTHTCDNVTFV